ncbi:MAG: hypothetical protein WCF17_08830 [Terracidiphilus sp.]
MTRVTNAETRQTRGEKLLGRLTEAGDEMIVNNGAYNNLRIAVGPSFRF